MDFGWALASLKRGKRVSRKNWNYDHDAKGMWLVWVKGYPNSPIVSGSPYGDAGLRYATIEAHIDCHTVEGTMQPGWSPSQADMLADDWELVS